VKRERRFYACSPRPICEWKRPMPGTESANAIASPGSARAAFRMVADLWLKPAAKWSTRLYLLGLVILLVWLEAQGERFWLSGILLFAPPQILLLPLVFLTPYCLIFRRRSVLWHVLAVALVAFGYMKFRWHPSRKPSTGAITAVTHNTGQGSRPQFYRFLESHDPDLIVLQDARGRGNEFARKYPDRHIAATGEFLAVSRWPIVQSEIVQQIKSRGRPVAARFEIQREEKPLIVYSVHLPTPRHQLTRFLSGRALGQMFGDDPGTQRAGSYGEWTADRIRVARELAELFAREPKPFLVFGDFNTPDHGIIYHTVARHLRDAHLEGGNGWGLTFPGKTRNPISARGPWLRIDYAFAGRGWEPISCTPEPGRASQHCAVVAQFVPRH
jgi:vancomycin resistance protein VanJ